MKKQIILGFTIVLITLSLALGDFVAAIESNDLSAQETIITGQDLSGMIGKKVQATGKFVKEKDKSRFDVNEIIELPNKSVEQHQPFEPNRQ